MLANTSSNPLTIPGERQGEREGHVITAHSFAEIKTIDRALHKQVRYDKKHGRSPYGDRDFDSFSDYALSVVTQDMSIRYAISVAIRLNNDIMACLNITPVMPKNSTYFYRYGLPRDNQVPLDVGVMAKDLDSLIARGRYGIWKKEMYNVHELGQIDKIYKRIDNANIDHD